MSDHEVSKWDMRLALSSKLFDILTMSDNAYFMAQQSGSFTTLRQRAVLLQTLEVNMPPFAKRFRMPRPEGEKEATKPTREFAIQLIQEGKIKLAVSVLLSLPSENDLEMYMDDYCARVTREAIVATENDIEPNQLNPKFGGLLNESIRIQRLLVELLQVHKCYFPTQKTATGDERIVRLTKSGFGKGTEDAVYG